MNFCIFAANYLPNVGGVERYTHYLAKELIKRGHSVTVVTSNVFHLAATETTAEGIDLCRLPCYNVMKGRYPIYKKNAEFRQLDRHIRAQHYDLVIVNCRFYLHSLYGARFAHEQGIPVITIEHGSSHLSVNNRLFDLFGEKWEHFITERLKKYCRHYYGVSQAACDWSGHFGIRSDGVLFNAIDLSEITQILHDPVVSYRTEYHIPADAAVITYTGRLVKDKGSAALAAAFEQLSPDNAYLLIAGDGEMMEEIQRIAARERRIIPLGRLNFRQVVSLLGESDVFCLPTVYPEGLPTSVLEAAAAKNLVITTRVGGAKEFILDDSYGILMDSNGLDELIPALQTAITDADYRRRAAEKSYMRLKEYFVWEQTASKVEEICRSMHH